jgi:putative transposase
MNLVDGHDFSVDLVRRVPGIAPSTYCGWRKTRTQPWQRAREDAEL